MPSGTVDRKLASFCTSGLRAVCMQAKSDQNYLPIICEYAHVKHTL